MVPLPSFAVTFCQSASQTSQDSDSTDLVDFCREQLKLLRSIRSDFVLDDWRSNRDDWCITCVLLRLCPLSVNRIFISKLRMFFSSTWSVIPSCLPMNKARRSSS